MTEDIPRSDTYIDPEIERLRQENAKQRALLIALTNGEMNTADIPKEQDPDEKVRQEVAVFQSTEPVKNYNTTPLTARQKMFVWEFVAIRHGTQAAINAGYTKEFAAATASKLLKLSHVNQAIRMAESRIMNDIEMEHKDLLNQLIGYAFSNVQDYLNPDLTMKPLDECPNIAAIQEIITEVTSYTGGITKTKTKIKLVPKLAALETIGKHIGFFDRDNKSKAPLQFNFENLNVEQIQAIATGDMSALAELLKTNPSK